MIRELRGFWVFSLKFWLTFSFKLQIKWWQWVPLPSQRWCKFLRFISLMHVRICKCWWHYKLYLWFSSYQWCSWVASVIWSPQSLALKGPHFFVSRRQWRSLRCRLLWQESWCRVSWSRWGGTCRLLAGEVVPGLDVDLETQSGASLRHPLPLNWPLHWRSSPWEERGLTERTQHVF